MSQEKIENIASAILLAAGASTYNVPNIVADLDYYVTFGFHILSFMSVFMVVVINRKKFVTEFKAGLKKWKK